MTEPGLPPPSPQRLNWATVLGIGLAGGALGAGLLVLGLFLLGWGFSGRGRHLLDAQKEHPVLPSWVPQYPGTHPKGWVFSGDGELSLKTSDLPEQVGRYYAEQLQANGFTVERPASPVFRLVARRADGVQVTLRTGQGYGRTWIALGFKEKGAP